MEFETIHEIRNRFFIKHEAPEEIADTIDYSCWRNLRSWALSLTITAR